MAAYIDKRTTGPLAEGPTQPSNAKVATEALPVARAKVSVCEKRAIFRVAGFSHIIFKWFGLVLAGVLLSANGRLAERPHPLYISVTEINHNPKEKILEVSCKMFTNDLEAALEKMTKTHVDLSAAKDKAASDKLIADYVGRHLRLKLDGKVVVLHFVGSEKEEDGTWSYFQVNDIPGVKRIDVVNELLYDSFNQQIGIMHVTVGGQRKSTRLDYPEANASFEF